MHSARHCWLGPSRTFLFNRCAILMMCIMCVGEHTHNHIDGIVVSEVCQKLNVTSDEVMHAVRSGDGSHPLAIAYELVRDNRLGYYIAVTVCDNLIKLCICSMKC